MRKNTKVLAPEISMLGRAIIKKWKQEVAEDTTRHSKKESSDKKLQACSSVTGPAPRSKEEFSPKPILLSDHLNSHHSKETMFSAASLLVDSSPAEANLPEAKVEVAFPVFQKTVFTHSAADAADSCIQEETKKAPQKFNVPTVLLRFYSLDKSSESDPAIKESLVRIANGERKWIGVDGVLDFNNNWRPWREDFFSPFLESDLGKVAPYTFVLRKHS
ncbi:hypothetical protein Zmor_004493 [Zophobas morio]|jgi:hypothetical protein|uniref:Uncharacterized protein n=1 Tax=Zophobas morio TaxID=2755281 RepID=A0AA38M0V2_9CUCU|nr:hypothetical protein Zmor_004493 [Zophobas morio]